MNSQALQDAGEGCKQDAEASRRVSRRGQRVCPARVLLQDWARTSLAQQPVKTDDQQSVANWTCLQEVREASTNGF